MSRERFQKILRTWSFRFLTVYLLQACDRIQSSLRNFLKCSFDQPEKDLRFPFLDRHKDAYTCDIERLEDLFQRDTFITTLITRSVSLISLPEQALIFRSYRKFLSSILRS